MNKSMINVILWDIVPVLATYYICRALGVHEYGAMTAATAAGLLRVVWVAVSQRKLDGFAATMVVVFGVGLALSFATGDEKFLMATKSLTTGILAAVLIGTVVAGKPAAFSIVKRFGADSPEQARDWDRLYAAEPSFRRVYLVMTLVAAGGLLAESLIRIPLIYLLSTDIMAALSQVLLWGTIALIGAWSAWYGQRGEKRARAIAAARPAP